jgi:hypothetical protein
MSTYFNIFSKAPWFLLYHMFVGNVSFFGTMPMTEVSTLGSSINTKRQLGPASSAAEGVGCAEGMVLGNECGYSHGFHRKIDNSSASEGLKITRLFSYLLGEGMAGKAEGKADGPPGDASTCAGSGAESLEVPECDG